MNLYAEASALLVMVPDYLKMQMIGHMYLNLIHVYQKPIWFETEREVTLAGNVRFFKDEKDRTLSANHRFFLEPASEQDRFAPANWLVYFDNKHYYLRNETLIKDCRRINHE